MQPPDIMPDPRSISIHHIPPEPQTVHHPPPCVRERETAAGWGRLCKRSWALQAASVQDVLLRFFQCVDVCALGGPGRKVWWARWTPQEEIPWPLTQTIQMAGFIWVLSDCGS